MFSYWRTVEPEACFEPHRRSAQRLADQAAAHGVTIGIENEHACNIGTGEETARVLAALDHPNLKVVWDPANALVAGESPMEGYAKLPVERIAHVHAKDCTVENHKATWLELGTGAIPWPEQIDALARDGYAGWISLETHWPGPNGDKLRGQRDLRAEPEEAGGVRERVAISLLLFLIPQLPRQRPAAERTIIHAHELMPVVAEYQEIFGVDLGDDGSVRELMRLRVAREIAVHQAFEFGAAGHVS